MSETIRKWLLAGVIPATGGLILALLWWLGLLPVRTASQFDGQKALAHVAAQMQFGPRVTASAANLAAGDYIAAHLRQSGWQVEFQPFEYQGTAARNIIARANAGRGPVIILGAHYDSRRRADQDPQRPTEPVPGANDGASGVAILLELARSLDRGKVPNEIWLAFFDAEDNGGLDGWAWIVGSTYMAQHLDVQPKAMILVDMVGDTDQQIYLEGNSDPVLSAQIWATAANLGYGQHFLPLPRFTMEDDHIPFRNMGIPAVDIIDFDYPYWHTTADTADKVSADSLERVGRTLAAFLQTPDK